MKIVIELTQKEINKLNEMVSIGDKESEYDIVDAIHTLIDVAM